MQKTAKNRRRNNHARRLRELFLNFSPSRGSYGRQMTGTVSIA
jgi:hypothetical protein